ncbi:MAG: GNAT family N-acetyltransferase [Actinobacteria bacterium]|nr:GNAT family N-acetyltransferase [Actinomycetota bacterium]MBU1942986.1 GNAT family N-acetyltransferase [Actinomycetota bacterium]MBU2687773.1 GNAT family N-acetyltransferase [Actinomycetota bacterium]
MYQPLYEENSDEALALLEQCPEYNVVLLSNINTFGMDPGSTPFHAAYLGRREGGRLVAMCGRYNLGSLFFHAESHKYMEGMGAHLLGLGILPGYMAGPASELEVVLSELEAGGVGVDRQPADFMLLREVVQVDVVGMSRGAEPGDLGVMVEMAAMFEEEMFGTHAMATDAARDLISAQMTHGFASVVEVDGRIVSKAEATAAPGYGAQVGGVYTLPGARGRGYSQACVAHLCRRCLETVPSCSLTVHKDNYPALGVYHRIGFSRVAEWLIATLER